MDPTQTIFNTHEAKTHLSKLIARAEAGEEIIIARAGKPAVKMIATDNEIEIRKARRKPGRLKGQIWYADDWDSPETNALIAGDYENNPIFPED
ncbi:MAG: type II toxin-antitoxin system Phd/YefM family antitoxin [Bdellovibrionales bacterium]